MCTYIPPLLYLVNTHASNPIAHELAYGIMICIHLFNPSSDGCIKYLAAFIVHCSSSTYTFQKYKIYITTCINNINISYIRLWYNIKRYT